MAHRRFRGVEVEAGGEAKEASKCQSSAGGKGESCLLAGSHRTVVPTPRPGLIVIYGTGPRACARGYYPRPRPGAESEAVRIRFGSRYKTGPCRQVMNSRWPMASLKVLRPEATSRAKRYMPVPTP